MGSPRGGGGVLHLPERLGEFGSKLCPLCFFRLHHHVDKLVGFSQPLRQV